MPRHIRATPLGAIFVTGPVRGPTNKSPARMRASVAPAGAASSPDGGVFETHRAGFLFQVHELKEHKPASNTQTITLHARCTHSNEFEPYKMCVCFVCMCFYLKEF